MWLDGQKQELEKKALSGFRWGKSTCLPLIIIIAATIMPGLATDVNLEQFELVVRVTEESGKTFHLETVRTFGLELCGMRDRN